MTENQHQHNSEACPSIREIQFAYFEGLANHAGPLLASIVDKNLTGCQQIVDSLRSWLPTFWSTHVDCLQASIQMLGGLKMVYGIDSHFSIATASKQASSFISNVGMYVDTVIVTDPVFTQLQMIARMSAESKLSAADWYGLLYRSMSAASSLYTAVMSDVTPPLCIIVPDYLYQTTETISFVRAEADRDAISLMSAMLGKPSEDPDEVRDLLKKIHSADDLDAAILNRSLWQTLTNQPGAKPSDVVMLWEEGGRYVWSPEESAWYHLTLGQRVYLHIQGLYCNITELLLRGAALGANPLLTDDRYWNALVLRNELLGEGRNLGGENALVAKTLLEAETSGVKLISGMPIDDLILLRKQGTLQEIRKDLFENLHEVDAAAPGSRAKIISQVTRNVESVLSRHEADLQRLATKERHFLGSSVLPCIANVGLAITASFHPELQLFTQMVGMIGYGTFADVLRQYRPLREEAKAVRTSPSALLFRRLEKKK